MVPCLTHISSAGPQRTVLLLTSACWHQALLKPATGRAYRQSQRIYHMQTARTLSTLTLTLFHCDREINMAL